MSFCAICLSSHGPFTREPLGKRDALVLACERCTREAVVPRDAIAARRGFVVHSDERDYGSMSTAERVKAHRAKLKAQGLCTNGREHARPINGHTRCEDCRGGKRRRRAA